MTLDLPLSAAQLGIWYALKAGAPVSGYNIAEYIRISGEIDPALYEATLRQVVDETEALCVRFFETDDGPRQKIEPPTGWRMVYLDLSAEPDAIAAAEHWMRDDLAEPVDLYRGPFFRFALFRTGPQEFLSYGRFHHLVMDGFAGSMLVRRVAQVYSGLAEGTPVAFQTAGSLAALIEEDAAYRQSGHFAADRQFWLDVMSDAPEPPSLGFATPLAAEPVLHLATDLPPALVEQLQRAAVCLRLTFPQLITLSTALFLHRLTDAEDIVLGQFMTARMTPAARQTPAMVRNVMPLRLAIQPDMRLEELAVQVRRKMRTGLRHQRYCIADLRRDLRRIDRPIIRQFVSVKPFDYGARFAGAPGTAYTVASGPVDDLNIHVGYDPSEQGVCRLEFEANARLYDRAFLARLKQRFLHLLTALEDPAAAVGRLDILPPDERRQVLFEWNRTRTDIPRDRCVHELFEEQARRTPDRVAVVYQQQSLTYRELNEQADRVAHHLVMAGVGPDRLVGFLVDRSLRMLIGLLGILKAGGAYIPLDPHYPRDRLNLILEDAQPLVLLTEQSLRDRLQPGTARVLCLDALPRLPAKLPRTQPAHACRPTDLACVLYTSGSTGKPKGVLIPHSAMVNLLKAMQREPGITADDRLLAITSLSFDIAGLELYLPLVAGAQVTIAPADVVADSPRLAALMQECGATIMQATPVTWRLLLEAGWSGSRDLRILCGGEAWPTDLAGALLPRCASLWNMYGPTETTVWSAVARIGKGDAVLIGPPIANTTFYVLDRYGQPVPIGVPGELHIGGDGVACGYLGRPELTAERFVADPFGSEPAARMYRTGDQVRQLPDGRLEFLGRLDHQVKIRGFRVEPGEIEAVLRLHAQVQDAVVIARDDRDGEKRLVAYVTASGSAPVPVGALRDFLRRQLAPYMVPTAIVALDAFPLTPNGKLDRKALPVPDDQMRRDSVAALVATRTPLEQRIAGFWCDCLQLQQVGIHDNFFDLGGDSLSMIRLSLEIERVTGKSVPLTSIFDAPTVAGMAAMLAGRKMAAGFSPLVLLRPGDDAPPVFLVHPTSGSTMQFIQIAKSFAGRNPIYGIQAKGFDGTDTPNDRIEAMVDDYLEAITEVQPHGPYFFVGLCFGGLVAVELARRLTERGETIGLLGFLDTFPHPRYCALHLRLMYLVTRGMTRGIKEMVAAVRTPRRHAFGSYVAAQLRLALRKSAALLWGNHSFLQPPDSLPPAIKAVFDAGNRALANYRPRYFPGKVNFLVCGYHEYPAKIPRAVWDKLVEQLEVQFVPAESVREASLHAEYVANWLADRIQEAPMKDVVAPFAEPMAAPCRPGQKSAHLPAYCPQTAAAEQIGASRTAVYSETSDRA